MMAIVAEGNRGRVYLAPTAEMEAIALTALPTWRPETPLPDDPRNFWTVHYGLTSYGDLFTDRQLVALTAFSDIVQEARERVKADALAAGRGDEPTPLCEGGMGAASYADAVVIYLGLGVSKATDMCNALCAWGPTDWRVRHLFARQTVPMVWDYAETSPLNDSAGAVFFGIEYLAKALQSFRPNSSGTSVQADAANQRFSISNVVSTDPPYYDNIGYADLSDFFYVWLRRSLKPIFPELFATLAVPKAEELVATPYRHGGKENAESFFLDGMTLAMEGIAEQSHPAFPVTIYYAF